MTHVDDLVLRRHDHDQTSSFHSWRILDGPRLGQLLNDGIHDRAPHLLIGHLPTSVRQCHLRLVSFLEKSLNLPNLDFQVVFIGSWAELDLLDLGRFLMSAALVVLLAEFIFVFPVVHDATDGRHRCRGHLHQIIPSFLGLSERVRGWQNTKLLSLRTDHANFTYSDFTIHSQLGTDRPPLNVWVEDPGSVA